MKNSIIISIVVIILSVVNTVAAEYIVSYKCADNIDNRRITVCLETTEETIFSSKTITVFDEKIKLSDNREDIIMRSGFLTEEQVRDLTVSVTDKKGRGAYRAPFQWGDTDEGSCGVFVMDDYIISITEE